MTRRAAAGFVYLAFALAMEHGLLPALAGGDARGAPWRELRLAAMGAVLGGALAGGPGALVYAGLCALTSASLRGPGHIGATLCGFAAAAWMAEACSRFFFLDRFAIRWPVFFGLAAAERWITAAARAIHRPEAPREISWTAIALTATAGAILYAPVAWGLRFRKAPPMPIGRGGSAWRNEEL